MLIVTGLPATGKTTLAKLLARRFAAPLIAKDLIKEPLLDVLGAADSAASRVLSDASFAVLFALARELRSTGASLLLEGNFRRREHAAPLQDVLSAGGGAPAACAQILCRVEEPERLQRLAARARDPTRHCGHRDAEQAAIATRAAQAEPGGADYLDLPGERFTFTGLDARDWPRLLERIDRWWRR